MVGETKLRRSPTNLQLALPECESLIVGPACDSAVEEASAVFCWPQPSAIHCRSWFILRPVPVGAPTTPGEEGSVVQNHIEQCFMNPDAAVVFNKSELTKAIHKETNA